MRTRTKPGRTRTKPGIWWKLARSPYLSYSYCIVQYSEYIVLLAVALLKLEGVLQYYSTRVVARVVLVVRRAS
jgi:hypothetical protein